MGRRYQCEGAMMADLGLPASSVSILSLLLRRHMSSTRVSAGSNGIRMSITILVVTPINP